MLCCIMCISNDGVFEHYELGHGHWCTIDKITLKISDGRRLRRYAVCVDGRWNSDHQMTLREARDKVEQIKHDYSRPVFKPIPIYRMRQYAKDNGAKAAHDLLLLGGYGFVEGTCRDYDELLKEFERGMKDVPKDAV